MKNYSKIDKIGQIILFCFSTLFFVALNAFCLYGMLTFGIVTVEKTILYGFTLFMSIFFGGMFFHSLTEYNKENNKDEH